jgi:transcriptional regulator with XRE-family HTH domain
MPRHGDQGKLAHRLGLSQDQVSRWSTGGRKPDPKARALLEDELGIDWRSWDEAPESAPDEKAGAA